jgi:hypothetical protein
MVAFVFYTDQPLDDSRIVVNNQFKQLFVGILYSLCQSNAQSFFFIFLRSSFPSGKTLVLKLSPEIVFSTELVSLSISMSIP